MLVALTTLKKDLPGIKKDMFRQRQKACPSNWIFILQLMISIKLFCLKNI